MVHGPKPDAAYFVNQVLLPTAMLIRLGIVYGCLCTTRAEMSSFNRDRMAFKA